MIGVAPCTVCTLVDGDTAAKAVEYAACCDAWLCRDCRWSPARRARAMARRDGLGGGLVGLIRRIFA